jgi:mitogen-activated protein kinase 7
MNARGYHTLVSSFGKVFHVERRWKMIRDMGSGAYGVVMYVQCGAMFMAVLIDTS